MSARESVIAVLGHASAYCGLCASVESVRLIERAERAGWVYR